MNCSYIGYIEFKKKLGEQINDLLSEAQEDGGMNLGEKCCLIQQDLIEYGTNLENNYHLAGSPIVEWLELFCEVLYRYSEGIITKEDFTKYVSNLFSKVDSEYFRSVSLNAHELSIAAIVKDEKDIIEWIEYHRMVGVEHFYIYDNEGTDDLENKLDRYIKEGIVTYIYFPGQYRQMAAYNHAVDNYQFDTKRLAIVDADEFIIPMEEGKKLPQVIEEIELNYQNHRVHNPFQLGVYGDALVGGIGVNWRCYGTSNHKQRCEGLLIHNYKYRCSDKYYSNVHIKTICNPRTVLNVINPHFAQYVDVYMCISENGSYIPYAFFYDGMCEKIRINHYYSRSEDEFIKKLTRGWATEEPPVDVKKKLSEAVNELNEVYDPIMERFENELEERVYHNKL